MSDMIPLRPEEPRRHEMRRRYRSGYRPAWEPRANAISEFLTGAAISLVMILIVFNIGRLKGFL